LKHVIFTKNNLEQLCQRLARKDVHLKRVILQYGVPPLWTRPASFETLVWIILEQQVSLASAYAAYKKLKEYTAITPARILQLTDAELRDCYFSRQKTVYVRELAMALQEKTLRLNDLNDAPDETVRAELKKIKGIGDWTADVYLMQCLQRTDIFPVGDLALVKGMKEIKNLQADTPKETLLEIATAWRPYRSVATMLCWHHYIKTRNMTVWG
jgi:DNA-3-methyladenine glycosylase II